MPPMAYWERQGVLSQKHARTRLRLKPSSKLLLRLIFPSPLLPSSGQTSRWSEDRSCLVALLRRAVSALFPGAVPSAGRLCCPGDGFCGSIWFLSVSNLVFHPRSHTVHGPHTIPSLHKPPHHHWVLPIDPFRLVPFRLLSFFLFTLLPHYIWLIW